MKQSNFRAAARLKVAKLPASDELRPDVSVGPIPTILSQRADNIVLATAASAGTPYIVTGDREMQALGSFQDVHILSPRAFLELLARQQFGASSRPEPAS